MILKLVVNSNESTSLYLTLESYLNFYPSAGIWPFVAAEPYILSVCFQIILQFHQDKRRRIPSVIPYLAISFTHPFQGGRLGPEYSLVESCYVWVNGKAAETAFYQGVKP